MYQFCFIIKQKIECRLYWRMGYYSRDYSKDTLVRENIVISKILVRLLLSRRNWASLIGMPKTWKRKKIHECFFFQIFLCNKLSFFINTYRSSTFSCFDYLLCVFLCNLPNHNVKTWTKNPIERLPCKPLSFKRMR